MIFGLLVFTAAALFIFVLSLAVWSFTKPDGSLLAGATLVFLWCFHATAFVLVMGMIHCLSPTAFLFAALLGLFMLALSCRVAVGEGLSELRNIIVGVGSLMQKNRFATGLFVSAVLLVSIRNAVHVWFLSPYVYDTLTYHLPKVADWIQQGSLVCIETPVARSYWPANFELLQTFFALPFKHDFMIEVAGLPFYLLAVLSVASLCRSLGISLKWSLFAALAYALTPALLQNSISCKNDIAVAGVFLFVMALLLYLRRSDSRVMCGLVLIFMACCLGFGTKPYILFLMPGLLFLVDWRRLRSCMTRKKTTDQNVAIQLAMSVARAPDFAPTTPRKVLFLLILLSVLLASYWYARNVYQFGNPLYPVPCAAFERFYKAPPFGGLQQGSISLDSMCSSIGAVVTDRIFDSQRSYDPELANMCGWGWFVFALGIPCLFTALCVSGFRRLLAAFVTSLCVLLAFVSCDPWNMRFTTWFPAHFAIAFVLTLRLIQSLSVRFNLMMLASVALILNFVGSIDVGYYTAEKWLARLRTPVLLRTVDTGMEQVIAFIKPGERFAYVADGNDWIYPLYGPDFALRPCYLKSPVDGSIAAAARRMGVRHVFFVTVPGGFHAPLQKDIDDGHLIYVRKNLYEVSAEERP